MAHRVDCCEQYQEERQARRQRYRVRRQKRRLAELDRALRGKGRRKRP